MTDSMKFGPEWLRNMSNDSGTNGGGGVGGGMGGINTTGGGVGGSGGNGSGGAGDVSTPINIVPTGNNTNSISGSNGGSASAAHPRFHLAEYRYIILTHYLHLLYKNKN